MDFGFGRQSSQGGNEGGGEGRKFFRGASLSEGASSLFGSVAAKKDGLFNGLSSGVSSMSSGISSGISSTFDSVKKAVGPDDGSQVETDPKSKDRPQPQFQAPPPPSSTPGTESPSKPKKPPARPRPPSARSLSQSSFNGIPTDVGPDPRSDSSYGYDQPQGQQSSTNPFLQGQTGSDASQRTGLDNKSLDLSGTGGLQAPDRDLLAITPTSGANLPQPVQPKIRPPDCVTNGGMESDGDSTATEGCDEEEEPEDVEGGGLAASASFSSDMSWNSNPEYKAELDDLSRDCMEFMKGYVDVIFDPSEEPSQEGKAKFGTMCQQGPGRLWFARYVSAQRVNKKKVEETVFYSLVQNFAIALFECNEAEDYGPAKTLMNMCFTFYYEVIQPVGPSHKHYLYSYLKVQPIWQSLRFWNAAFFDAVQSERARSRLPRGPDGRVDDKEFQENITFGQLGTFTCNMRAFGLSKDLCLEFLRKQASLANLKEEQEQMLRENVEKWKE